MTIASSVRKEKLGRPATHVKNQRKVGRRRENRLLRVKVLRIHKEEVKDPNWIMGLQAAN